MSNRPADQWPHKTAKDCHTHGEPVGVDLFDETTHDNIPMTAIYLRFEDGTRWPARTVDMTKPEHSTRVLNAWACKGPVNDYRKNPNPEWKAELPVIQVECLDEVQDHTPEQLQSLMTGNA